MKEGDKPRASVLLREALALEAHSQDKRPSSPQPVVKINAANVNNIEDVIASKRTEALQHHKAGRAQEARTALAEAKRLEAEVAERKTNSTNETETYDNLWDELEAALKGVIAEHEDMDAGGGATWKTVSPELVRFKSMAVEVAKRRQILKCKPPKFQLERVTREREVVIQSLRSDDLVVVVKGLEDMVDDEKSRLGVNINVDTAILVDETARPPSSSHSANIENGKCTLDHTATFTIKRSQRHARRYEKRGVDVTLILKTRSFFGRVSEEVLAEGKLRLSPLINQCQHEEAMSLHLPGQSRKTRRGHVLIQVRVHHPIGSDGDGKDMRRVTMTNITMASWNNGSVPLQSTAPRVTPNQTSSRVPQASKPQRPSQPNAQMNKQFGELTLQERKTPLSAQHVISEAVINHLLASTSDPMVKMTLNNQMMLLQVNFDNGMTPDVYLTNLSARISRDMLLSKYLLTCKRQNEAAKVVDRIKIMKKEITDLKEMLTNQQAKS